MRIYLKLQFIHFKEKIWQFKDVVYQLNVLLTFSWLCGQKSAKWTTRPPPGKLTCPTHGAGDEICALRLAVQRGCEWQEKPLSPAYTRCFGLLHGGEPLPELHLHKGVPGHWRTHPAGAGSPPSPAHPHPRAPSQGRELGPIGQKEPHLVTPVSITQHYHQNKGFVSALALWN